VAGDDDVSFGLLFGLVGHGGAAGGQQGREQEGGAFHDVLLDKVLLEVVPGY
jgi:hypothetical protein